MNELEELRKFIESSIEEYHNDMSQSGNKPTLLPSSRAREILRHPKISAGLKLLELQKAGLEVKSGVIEDVLKFIDSYLVTTVGLPCNMHHIDDSEWISVKERLLRKYSGKIAQVVDGEEGHNLLEATISHRIQQYIKDNNYVQLADDQSLPRC